MNTNYNHSDSGLNNSFSLSQGMDISCSSDESELSSISLESEHLSPDKGKKPLEQGIDDITHLFEQCLTSANNAKSTYTGPLADAKMVFHDLRMGDVVVRKAGEDPNSLEGSFLIHDMFHLEENLEIFEKNNKELCDKNPQFAKSVEALKILKHYQYSIQISIDINHSEDPQITFRHTLNDIKIRLANMEPGESFSLPGGYSAKDSHTMIYIIKKEENNTFSFEIINTGGGIDQYHTRDVAIEGKDYVHTKKYVDLDSDKLNKAFFAALLGFQDFKNTEPAKISAVYDHIDTHLKNGENVKEGRKHRQQDTGICGSKSLGVWFHNSIAPGDAKDKRNAGQEKLYLEIRKSILLNDKEKLRSEESKKFFSDTGYMSVRKGKYKLHNQNKGILGKISQSTIGKMKQSYYETLYKQAPKSQPMVEVTGENVRSVLDQEIDQKLKKIDKKISKLEQNKKNR